MCAHSKYRLIPSKYPGDLIWQLKCFHLTYLQKFTFPGPDFPMLWDFFCSVIMNLKNKCSESYVGAKTQPLKRVGTKQSEAAMFAVESTHCQFGPKGASTSSSLQNKHARCPAEVELSLQTAASTNDVEKVRKILSQTDVDLNTQTAHYKQTPLHLAAKKGFLVIVRLLLLQGADLNIRDVRGCSALHLTVDCPQNEVIRRQLVEILCMAGAELNYQTKTGETALSLSLRNKNLEIFKLLLGKSADVLIANFEGWTLLHIAAEMNICEALDMMEQAAGGCLKQMSEKRIVGNGMTALHVAAKSANFEMVNFLVERKLFNLLDRDEEERSVLHVAVENKQLAKVRFSLDKGWVIDEPASAGSTCLHLAVRNNHPEALELLLAKGADSGIPDATGFTPLEVAQTQNIVRMADILIAHGQHFETNGIRPSENETPMETNVAIDSLMLKKPLLFGHLSNLILKLALHRFFTFPADYDVRAGMSRFDLANSGFFFTFDYLSLQCFFCSLEIKSLLGWKDLNSEQINHRHDRESSQQFGYNF